MKLFSDVWYKPLPWCQFHFGNLQMFWWVPVCRFNIPPMPEPSSPVIIVTTCVLVRNARRWFWCNRGVGFFFLVFFPWRKQNGWSWSSPNKSLFYLSSGQHVLLCLALLLLECIKGRCTVHSACCTSSEKWRTAKFRWSQEQVGRFLSEGQLFVQVEVWIWNVLGLNIMAGKMEWYLTVPL